MTGQGSRAQPRLAQRPVAAYLDALASAEPVPAAGSAAALTIAQGAALCAKVVRLSAGRLPAEGAGELISRAERAAAAAAALIDSDAAAYLDVLAATRRGEDPAAALSAASDAPMRMVELAAEVAEVAAGLTATAKPALRGDARSAGLLAQAGARAAATLIGVNLAGTADWRKAMAARLLDQISRSVDPRAAAHDGSGAGPAM
jgi:formiminotetrahydrofolate cyclodeaminase